MKTSMRNAIELVLLLVCFSVGCFALCGCWESPKKNATEKIATDTEKKLILSGTMSLKTDGTEKADKTRVKVDGCEVESPGKTSLEWTYNTNEHTRDQMDSNTFVEYYKPIAFGIKILAVLLIVAGIVLALKFSPLLGVSVAAAGCILWACEVYAWLLLVFLGLCGVCAAWMIYEKYATEKQKDALASVVAAVETLPETLKGMVTREVSNASGGSQAVKDTITEIKRDL